MRIVPVVLGSAAVWLSLTRLPWYDTRFLTDEPDHYGFAQLHAIVGEFVAPYPAPVLAHAYFTWGAWTLLVCGAAFGLAAVFAVRTWAWLCAVAAAVIGVVGAVLTLVAVWQLFRRLDFDGLRLFSHTQPGLWLAAGGFLIIGLAPITLRARPQHSDPEPDRLREAT